MTTPGPFDDTPDQDQGEAVLSFSAKTGPGYEAGLINIRGTRTQIAKAFSQDPGTSVTDLVALWNSAHVYWAADYEGKAHPKGSAPATSSNGRPAGAGQAPKFMGEAPECTHGVWKYVTKFKEDGNAWHAWGCPAPKGSGCESGLDFRNDPNQK